MFKKTMLVSLLIILSFIALSVLKFFNGHISHVTYPFPMVSEAKACKFLNKHDNLEQLLPDNDMCIDVILINAPITSDVAKKFKVFLNGDEKHSQIVCIRSQGGNLEATQAISRLIRIHKLDTCLAEYYEIDGKYSPYNAFGDQIKFLNYKNQCLSSCPFLLMSGTNRYRIGTNFEVGIHHPGRIVPIFGFDTPLIFNEPFFNRDDNPWNTIVDESDINDQSNFLAFYLKALETPHDDMKYLTNKYLTEKRVFTSSLF